MNEILQFLNGEMNRPLPYGTLSEGWFHYLSLVLVIVASVIAITRMKNMSDKKLKKVLLIFAIILIVFEIYKQLIFSYQANWNYQWYAFPFQFCSTPMYVALFAGLTRNKKIFEALKIFLATFGLFAGVAVMLYPMTVFVGTIGINIQT
ncbi:MAG: YwaF family protein, partial [Firmicutes bacterium]|nr:YwaF family protein [Bacillota bacterium]